MNKILIVEDDPNVAQALMVRLSRSGYEIALSHDAVMMMTEAKRFRPDLAIVDLAIPGGDGFQVFERLQGDPITTGVPVLMLTAHRIEGLREKAKKAGVQGFLFKPYDSEELLQMIDTLLQRTQTTAG